MIIGFVGRAGAGKTESTNFLCNETGFRRATFAGALKQMMMALLVYRGATFDRAHDMVFGAAKETPAPELNGRTPRYAMQTLGTEWGREMISPTLWIETEFDFQKHNEHLVFEDVRFPEEVEAIRARGGRIIKLTGRGHLAGEAAQHASETHELDADYVIENDKTLDDLFSQLLQVIDYIAREQTAVAA